MENFIADYIPNWNQILVPKIIFSAVLLAKEKLASNLQEMTIMQVGQNHLSLLKVQ
jgi:hypothetical protein